MQSTWILALAGGALIGVASAFLLLTHGRIAGISGIVGSLLQSNTRDRGWRIAFVVGMASAGVVASIVAPSAVGTSVRTLPLVIVAGLLVGYGTRLGSGCTSGHGVCGMSRLAVRSLIAVITFMATGALTATLVGGAA
ncbi:MAG TPA: YeeE/YedE family protein [Kofleriaceae bacterium]